MTNDDVTPGGETRDEASLRQAAEAGEVAAMMALADLLNERYDAYAEDEEAQQQAEELAEEVLEWYRRAAEAGDVEGMYTYGLILFNDGDAEGAQPWLQRAADAGHAEAMDELGCVYDFLEDSDMAVHWFQRAAEGGSRSGEQNLKALKEELARRHER